MSVPLDDQDADRNLLDGLLRRDGCLDVNEALNWAAPSGSPSRLLTSEEECARGRERWREEVCSTMLGALR